MPSTLTNCFQRGGRDVRTAQTAWQGSIRGYSFAGAVSGGQLCPECPASCEQNYIAQASLGSKLGLSRSVLHTARFIFHCSFHSSLYCEYESTLADPGVEAGDQAQLEFEVPRLEYSCAGRVRLLCHRIEISQIK